MSFKCQIFQTTLTFHQNVFAKNCDVRFIIIICVISAILPIIKCAKLENPQIRLLINDDDLLQEKTNIREQASAAAAEPIQHENNSGEHFHLYRSELKRLSYETIHRILRDENEPNYRREDTELRYYQKRSPSYEQNHQLIKRSTKQTQEAELSLRQQNLSEFLVTSQIQKRLNLVSILDLSHNYIAQLNISLLHNISGLRVLNLENNHFTSIPLQRDTTLRTLNLNNNLIKSSLLNSNIYLRNLHLSGNQIDHLASIEFSLLKNLESLDVSHNLLKTSEASFFTQRMHNLKHLNLAFNQLGSIYRETFYNLLSLNTLVLSHNNISDIDYETFLALPNLQYLDLSFNNLQGKSIRALQGITGLVALNIGFNPDIGPYMQEFVASWSLKELDASGTGLCQIPAALAQSVRSLKLTHNWLKIINCGDLDSYPLLQYLDLSFSHIEHIEDDALGRLEILEILMLDHNKLLKIPSSLPVSLEHLFLQNNDIMEIPQQAFQGLSNLKTLDLSHNKLLYLPDITLPKLQTLNLQSSDIRGISQGIIHTLPKLTDLMLEDNPIKCADLLGIAEWASTCRLRVEKDGEAAEQAMEMAEEDDDGFGMKMQNLKNKFEKMHNFYEQFGLNTNTTYVNETLLSYLKAPSCVRDYLNILQQTQEEQEERERKMEKKLMPKSALSKTLKEINFNQNSMTSRPFLSTEKSFPEHNNIQADAVRKQLEDEYESAVKTITIANPAQTNAATTARTTIQSSILNEKQQATYTTPESFNSIATTTAAAAVTTTGTNVLANELEGGIEIVVKPRFTNEMKTFERLTANADPDAGGIAATKTNQHDDEIASIGNTPAATKSSSNMTEVVEAVAKQTKAAHNKQQRLKDMQHRTTTTFAKTFQTTKSKKWLKQEIPLEGKGSKEMTQIMLEHSTSSSSSINSSSEDINAPQFIKSTTFATPINSEKQATTAIAPTQQPTATSLVTQTTPATIANAFVKLKEKDKHDTEERGGGRKDLKGKDMHVVGFKGTTSKLDINLENEKQLHEIKTKIATTEEIKSLAAIKNPKSMQTKITAPPPNKRIGEITKQIPTEQTANLNEPNKELNGLGTTHSNKTTFPPTTKITTTSIDKPAVGEKHELETSTTSSDAAIWKAFKATEARTIDTTTTAAAAASILVKNIDSASNYNDNDNREQITKTTNKVNNNSTAAITTTTTKISTTPSDSSTISGNKNNIISKTFNTATSTTISTIAGDQHQQQPPHLLQNTMMSHYRQPLKKDVNVKCTQSNFSECNSTATTTATAATHRPDEALGRTPTMEATLEQTTVSKTSTEIPPETAVVDVAAVATAAAAAATLPTSVAITTLLHKREPLQLLVKDRHLIGTPLLMHKGENLMVTADELILPTNDHRNVEQEENNNSSDSTNKESHDLDTTTNTLANDNKNKHNLERSQTTQLTASMAEVTLNSQIKDEHHIHKPANEKQQENVKSASGPPTSRPVDLEKIRKSNYETKTKKPSLIMKKMTIITKQHEQENQHVPLAEPLENEVHAKQFDNSHYQELKPLLVENLGRKVSQTHMLKHSTVNTPISAVNAIIQNNGQTDNMLKQPHTFQHEHELLVQQILQEQQAETHAKLTKSEQWSDLRKAESKENHPGLILLVSSGLFLVLLLGLMHVYRCDMPWRRHSPSHHLRPHQRQNHSLEDDSHSFLSYNEGMQKWHHSARLEAPYNSPLHNLHVRELQKTSAIEKPATFKAIASNFKPSSLSHSIALDRQCRSLSQSSTTTATSTASATSSAILDDESFYIEMAPDSGQYARILQAEILPMELLNVAQAQTLDHQDNVGDSQTSMEDECVVHFQQQQQRYRPTHLQSLHSSSSASVTLPCSTASATSTTSLSIQPQPQTRKFGLW